MRRSPLPQELQSRSFTTAQATDASLSRSRTYASDLHLVSRGIRIPRGVPLVGPHALAAYTMLDATSVIMDLTAAHVHGMPLPSPEAFDWRVHLGRPAGATRPRRLNTVGRVMSFLPGEVMDVDGLRITTPARTWLDLAARLDLGALVAAGDFLVCEHGPDFPVPRVAVCQTGELRDIVRRHPGMRGIRTARAALDLIRVGADSPKETELRLALLDAGLPDPETNTVLWDDGGIARAWPDLAYREYRLSIQYDGGVHGQEEQYQRDIERQLVTERLGWREVRVSKQDLDGEQPAAVGKIRDALLRAGWAEPGNG